MNELADLYLWLVDRYPYAEDPGRSGADTITQRQQIAEWRDAVLRTIVNRGTDAAVEAVRSIEAALPDQTWLGRLRRQAEEARRQDQWQPVDPTVLLRLLAAPSRRLINSERHLSAVVVEALTSIQTQLTGDNPASHDLWDTHARRPKSEDEVSDWLTRHLEQELSDTLTLVDREVQIRRTGHGIGERTDILVQVAMAGNLLRLPIEVKGIWHEHVLAGLEQQLVGQYMTDLNTAHGIYLVLWPDQETWALDDPRRAQAEHQSATGRQLLDHAARNLRAAGWHVVVQHLDISYRRPAPNPGTT